MNNERGRKETDMLLTTQTHCNDVYWSQFDQRRTNRKCTVTVPKNRTLQEYVPTLIHVKQLSQVRVMYSVVFLYWLHTVHRIPPLSSTLFVWGQSRSIHMMSLFDAPPGLESPAATQTPTLVYFCLPSQWQHESAPAWFDTTEFRVCFDVSDRRCLGPQLELALLHPPHHHRIFLCPQPGAGSPLRVGSHFSLSWFLKLVGMEMYGPLLLSNVAQSLQLTQHVYVIS